MHVEDGGQDDDREKEIAKQLFTAFSLRVSEISFVSLHPHRKHPLWTSPRLMLNATQSADVQPPLLAIVGAKLPRPNLA